jgi:NADH-quinone oxidoreductase subunit G
MNMISIRIDDKPYQVPANVLILDACRDAHIYVPTLCYHPDLPAAGHCGLCSVKIDGSMIAYACMTAVTQGMSISTKDPDIISKAQRSFDALMDMPNPPHRFEIELIMNHIFQKKHEVIRAAETTPAITFSPEKCVKCSRCVRACSDIMDIGALDDPAVLLKGGPCVSCGICTITCPTASIAEVKQLPLVYRALAAGRSLACIIDVAACVGVREALGCRRDEIGLDGTDILVSACRAMGFRHVFDAKSAVDLVTAEIAEEFADSSKRPFIPAVCPAVVNYIEKLRPELLPNLSKVKSPAQYLADLIRLSFAANSLFIVQLTSCVAAKDEAQRPQLRGAIDAVLTIREFATAFRAFGLDWESLRPAKFDAVYSLYSRTAPLTATPGGWFAAISAFLAARDDVRPPSPVFDDVTPRIRTSDVSINGQQIRLAIIDGLGAAQHFLQDGAPSRYDFIDICACPGSCAFGGGQARLPTSAWAQRRIESLRQVASRSAVASAYETLDGMGHVLISLQSSRARKFFKTRFQPQKVITGAAKRNFIEAPVVVYESADGRAAKYARVISQMLKAAAFSMNRLSVPDMIRRQKVIFICNTTGERQFPGNAQRFVKTLKESPDRLSEVQYAILGLGKRGSTVFGMTERALEELMDERQAKPIIPTTCLDPNVDEDEGDIGFAKWSEALAAQFGVKRPKFGLETVCRLETRKDEIVEEHPLRPKGFEFARVTDVILLSPEDFHPAMRKVVIELPVGMSYDVGDQVVLLPRNDPPVVDRVLKMLGLNEKEVFQHDGSTNSLIPGRISMRQLFSQYIDLNGLPTRDMLASFCEVANAAGKSRLMQLIDQKSNTAFQKLLENTSIADCLCEFAQYGIPPLDVLVSTVPAIEPRIYAIASSPQTSKGFIDILVLEVLFGKSSSRHGLSTYFLANSLNQTLPIYTKHGAFRYPMDITTPMIMVALGSGLSPMLALLQHRSELDVSKLGPALLFVGTRFENSFPLLFKKIRTFVHEKVLTALFHAVSRERDMRHVQDLLRDNPSTLWDLWQDHRTVFYYCGPKRAVSDELKEIMLSLTVSEGWLSREEAMAFNGRHEWMIEES